MWNLSQNSKNFLPVNWDPLSVMDDVGENRHRLFCPEVRDGAHLHPLGELVDRDQQMGEAPGRLSEGPDDVQPPHGEWPCYGDGLQGVGGKVGLAGVELAPFAGAYDFTGVCDRGRPVKALAESIVNEGVRRGVMAADPGVDVPQELAPLGDGHAPLQDARGGALVQLAVNEGKGLGHPGDAPGRGPVRGEFPSSHPGDIFVAPVSLDRSWLDVHHVGLVGAIPLEEGKHVRLVRGVLIRGFRTRWIRGSPRGFCVA
jgi:hypothetical protein